MTTLWLDTETYSEANLKEVGAYRYAEHESTEVLLVSWAIDDELVQVWDATTGEPMPAKLRAALEDPEVLISAHNSMFDRAIVRECLGIDTAIERWRDTMVKAYTAGLPGALEQLGIALGVGDAEAKIRDGKRLISKFCQPRPKNHKVRRLTRETSPEDWQRFIDYARQDTAAMRRIDRMIPEWNWRGNEIALWHLDQRANDRGLPVDPEAAKAAIDLVERATRELNAELTELTGGAVTAGAQVEKLIEWLGENGCVLPNAQAGTIERALKREDLPDDVRRALEIRQETARTSTSKYKKLLDAMCSDGRLHGAFQFYGAMRTGRWAGRLFQPQNLMRPTIDDIETGMEAILANLVEELYDEPVTEVAGSCIRAAIKAPPGRKLLPCDLSNIEGRKLAWLAGEDWKLQAFREFDAGLGPDLYKLAYSRSFGVRVDDVTKDDRQIGKVEELALGYQGSAGAFASMAANYNMDLDALYEAVWSVATDEHKRKAEWTYDMQRPSMKKTHALAGYAITYAWRDAHPATVRFWGQCEAAAIQAVENPGRTFKVNSLLFSVRGHGEFDWLLVKLPSGRFLCYFKPEVNEVRQGERTKKQLSYMGINQYTRRFEREPTYGGKLVENITQASARDVLVHPMPKIERRGYEIIGSVHDELLPEAPDNEDYSVREVEQLMCEVPPWAKGLPLAAKGYESKRYRK